MAITPLPTPPSRSAPSTFSTLADAFLGALPTFVTEANAQAAALDLNDTTDASSSSVEIGLGAKTFTVTAAKSFQPGMWLIIADDAAPSTNQMFGSITSYSGTTLVMNITTILGSGTKSAWTISQSSPGGLTPGGPLGTPASGTLTHCTGLPVAGVIGAATSGANTDITSLIGLTGDLYNVAWTDYSGSSTIIGWVTPAGVIMYKKAGKLVFVVFFLTGTSNATNATFTLPYTNTALDVFGAITYGTDNGANLTSAGVINLGPGSATVGLYKGMNLVAWTASGDKTVYGSFWYEATA